MGHISQHLVFSSAKIPSLDWLTKITYLRTRTQGEIIQIKKGVARLGVLRGTICRRAHLGGNEVLEVDISRTFLSRGCMLMLFWGGVGEASQESLLVAFAGAVPSLNDLTVCRTNRRRAIGLFGETCSSELSVPIVATHDHYANIKSESRLFGRCVCGTTTSFHRLWLPAVDTVML